MLLWAVFVATLFGVTLFHRHSAVIAASGAGVALLFHIGLQGLDATRFIMGHDVAMLLNLGGLFLGFAVLTQYVTDSKLPYILPNFLPDNWRGTWVLLLIVMLLAVFLDHIAAALIGGTIAAIVFQKKVHIGYIAAIVGASNLGGVGSVLGNVTTTMMWLHGVPALSLVTGYIPAIAAFATFSVPAALLQDRHHRILADDTAHHRIHWRPLVATALLLLGVIGGNLAWGWPALGLWLMIGFSQFVAPISLKPAVVLAIPNTVFLLSLVALASLMPLASLPTPTVWTSFGLGWVSAVFDNIPLTQLALKQGGYEWPLLSYCVGFGGSMMWFGSAAGVAICTLFPEARSVKSWILGSWFMAVGYVVGFLVYLLLR